jgi:hypothetical protein
MKDQDWNPYCEAFAAMAHVMQVRPAPTPADYKAYWMYLQDLTLEQVKKAMMKAPLSVGKAYNRLPDVATLLRLATGIDLDHQATQAWEWVMTAMRRHGTYNAVDFDDGRINAALRSIGGWVELGMVETAQLDWRRREFLAAYKHACTEPPTADLMRPLRGRCDDEPKCIETGLGDGGHRQIGERTPGNVLRLVQGTAERMGQP